MDNQKSLIGQEIQGYTVIKELGSGGYGTVYLAEKTDVDGQKYKTAIKHISIPNEALAEELSQKFGDDTVSIEQKLRQIVNDIKSEVDTLLELSKQDNRYIVSYSDHEIKTTEYPLRFEVFIRMESLLPFNEYVQKNGLTLEKAFKLGINICEALELCHKSKIIHRDVKEANIFLSGNGNFKLGDFGVAKKSLDNAEIGTVTAKTMIGSPLYMAPEIFQGQNYDETIDIYSLGFTLYRLFNNRKNPPSFSSVTAPKDEADSFMSSELGQIIMKACRVREGRYNTAEDFKAQLKKYLETLSDEEKSRVLINPTKSAEPPSGRNNKPIEKTTKHPLPIKSKIIGSVALVAVLALIIGGSILKSHLDNPITKFKNAIAAGDYKKAKSLLDDDIRDNSKKKAEAATYLSNQAKAVTDKYLQDNGNYDDTLAKLTEYEKLNIISKSDFEGYLSQVNEIKTSQSAYEAAQDMIKNKDYVGTIDNLRKVVQKDGNYTDAQSQLVKVVSDYKKSVFDTLTQYDDTKEYDKAISELERALKVVPNDADILAKIDGYKDTIAKEQQSAVDAIIKEADALVAASNDYEGAVKKLKEGQRKYAGNEALKTAVDNTNKGWVTFVLAAAGDFANNGEYEDAVRLLENWEDLNGKNAEITAKINEYTEFLPVDITTVKVSASGGFSLKDTLYDSVQNLYRNAYSTNSSNYVVGEYDLEFYVNGNYKRFTGKLACHEKYDSDVPDQVVRIYADDQLIYTSKGINYKTKPFEFDVDISDAQYIIIKTKIPVFNNDIIFADGKLYKK
ncbi:hypothetical protein AGMMS49975_06230 [Clostridia bacterium]|nr:hypothetical protein AGMMS49975_06230 [Clostridia bacterium]